jgi:hypothetical protein
MPELGVRLRTDNAMGGVIAAICAKCGRKHEAGAQACAGHEIRAPLRYYAEYGRRYAARDLNAFMELFTPGWEMVDHRAGMSPGPIGVATCRAWTASVFAVSPDVRFAIDDVLACDERVITMRASYHGNGPGGRGEFAFLSGFVTVVEHGHSIHVDQYEYDDDAAMLARYAELTRG